MKKHFKLLFGLTFVAFLQFVSLTSTQAQTDMAGIVVQVKTTAGTSAFKSGDCGYGTATWGGAVTDEFCAQAAWGFDITPDSLGCDSIPAGSLAGKIALIRRGLCEFGLKALNAEKAGAVAVLIVNDNRVTDNDCTQIPIGPGAVGAQVTIPVFFASRGMGRVIDEAIQKGQLIEVCLLLPSLKDPTAEFSYATPVSQHGPLGLMTITYTNRSGAEQSDVVFKADVTDPTGQVTTFTTTVPSFAANVVDTLINFDEYQMPAIEGKFKVLYTYNKSTAAKDSVIREFVQTKYTYATDNLKINGSVGPDTIQFASAGYRYQTGSTVVTGPAGLNVSYASFGLGNAAAIAVGDPAADIINVLLYDNDADENGETDLTDAGFGDLIPIAYVDYVFTGTEKADSPIYVKLEDLTGAAAVTLKPDHYYMMSLLYDGNTAGSGKSIAFTRTGQIEYPQFSGIGLHTPLFLDQMYSGWGGASVVNRLHEEGFNPGGPGVPPNDPSLVSSVRNPRLNESKFNITPNPANDLVRLNMELAEINKSVTVSLIDFQGRVVSTQVQRNFQSGQITFEAKSLPSGAYSVWIRTTSEGSTMAKLLICH